MSAPVQEPTMVQKMSQLREGSLGVQFGRPRRRGLGCWEGETRDGATYPWRERRDYLGMLLF